MQASKEWMAPNRIWASASFRLVGDLLRMVCAVAADHCDWSVPFLGLPLERAQDRLDRALRKRPIDGTPPRHDLPGPRLFHEIGEHGVDWIAGRERRQKRIETGRLHVMGGSPRQHGIACLQPLSGQRRVGTDLACKSRQRIGAADIREKSDARLPASQTHSGRPQPDATREWRSRPRRPSRCRRSARYRACDSA